MRTGVKIKVLSGSGKGQVYAFSKNIITIGGDSGADVCIVGDPEIAPVHIEIQKRGPEFVLFDRSGRGTIVNNRRVEQTSLEQACEVRLTAGVTVSVHTGIDVLSAVDTPTRSLFRRPPILAAYGVYAAAIIVGAIYLSQSPTAPSSALTMAQESQVVQNYGEYLERNKTPDRDRKIRELQNYLRSAYLAEKSDHIDEAERIYLTMLGEQSAEMSRSGKDKRANPVYSYALSRINAIK